VGSDHPPSDIGADGMSARGAAAGTGGLRALPRAIWVLGLVSLFMDVSSELVHSLLPVFMVTVLGASMVTVGLVEGIAEAIAAIVKVFSGVISDHLRRRKLLAVLGYGLAALSKPLFPLASSVGWVATGRFVDRVGKGIRGAPRDALVADITPPHLRGAAYGLRQALDSVGALIGPLLAILFMMWLANDIRMVLWLALVPAALAVALLVAGVQEPDHDPDAAGSGRALFSAIGRLPRRYWLVIVLGSVFTMARFSEAFLVLRAEDIGLAIGYVPLVMVLMNLFYAASAYPAGAAADRMGARRLLLVGLLLLLAADIVLALATTVVAVLAGAALWGLHMGLTQGLLAKLVADAAPATLRGTAFGVFNLVTGIVLLLASLLAGTLWEAYGAGATFLGGALFAALALLGMVLYAGQHPPARRAG